jgi:hypothetical protein
VLDIFRQRMAGEEFSELLGDLGCGESGEYRADRAVEVDQQEPGSGHDGAEVCAVGICCGHAAGNS